MRGWEVLIVCLVGGLSALSTGWLVWRATRQGRPVTVSDVVGKTPMFALREIEEWPPLDKHELGKLRVETEFFLRDCIIAMHRGSQAVDPRKIRAQVSYRYVNYLEWEPIFRSTE